jgi:mannose-1-phosphate guanylyltransferase/phosphomannomutase
VNLPKPLVPVGNRPIMWHILQLLKRHGITEIVTTLHYLADEIQSAFGDGTELGLTITHSLEDIPLGTAGSVKQAELLLRDSTFVIISGDAMTDCDLTAAIAYHREKKSVATIVLSRVPNPREFGVVLTQPDGRIDRFLEKPDWSEVFSDTVNTGIYILEPEVFDLIPAHTNTDWSKDVFPLLMEQGLAIYGYIMEGYWCDVGTLEQYREAQEDLLNGKAHLDLPGELIADGVWVGRDTVIDNRVTIKKPVCIGDNVRIKRGAVIGPGTVIGDSCLVEENATITKSVIWNRCYVGIDAKIEGAIVGSRATIKRESRLQDGSVVGDRSLIDVGSTIRSRVKIWPDKTVERGSTVTMSLVVGNRWHGALFRELGVAGLSNIELTPEFATRIGLAYGSTLPPGSEVVVCRDSSRSSRMLKRSLIAALLSSGCRVTDLHGKPVPILRHYLKSSDAAGAVNVRKSPGNNRLSVIEFLGPTGAYLPRAGERKVESAFFREDFHRADPDQLGVIEEAEQATESYTRQLLASLPAFADDRRPKIVVDFGYGSVSPILPELLGKVGIDALGLNSYNDARSAPRRPQEIQDHISNLQQIVHSVGSELGALILNEGENIVVVDNQGLALSGSTLFATLCLLIASHQPNGEIVMSNTAPLRLERLLLDSGIKVRRCRSGVRDLMQEASQARTLFAGNDSGAFIFPKFHSGFDGIYSLITLVRLLRIDGRSLSEVVAELPEFHLAYGSIGCPWDAKGRVMRQLSERRDPAMKVEMSEGIKFFNDDSWALILPDSFEPVFHIYAESPNLVESQALVREYSHQIESIQSMTS